MESPLPTQGWDCWKNCACCRADMQKIWIPTKLGCIWSAWFRYLCPIPSPVHKLVLLLPIVNPSAMPHGLNHLPLASQVQVACCARSRPPRTPSPMWHGTWDAWFRRQRWPCPLRLKWCPQPSVFENQDLGWSQFIGPYYPCEAGVKYWWNSIQKYCWADMICVRRINGENCCRCSGKVFI